MPRLALIGDYDSGKPAHVALPRALELAATATGVTLEWSWIETGKISDPTRDLADYSGIWVVPGSPYQNMQGVLAAIRHVRENRIPFLGTCGGFQHAIIEFARNVAGFGEADHAESNPLASDLVVAKLACSLVNQSEMITPTVGSRLHGIFGGRSVRGEYHCHYGVNPAYRVRLESAGLCFTGFDAAGEIRAAELASHPFFIGTLFQPERSALRGEQHPLIQAFVRAVAG